MSELQILIEDKTPNTNKWMANQPLDFSLTISKTGLWLI